MMELSLITAELKRKGKCFCYSCAIIEFNRREKQLEKRTETLAGHKEEPPTRMDEES